MTPGPLRLYLHFAAISIRGQLQYRVAVLAQMLGHLLTGLIEFAGIWVLFHRFHSLGAWTLPEIAFLYGVIQTAFAIVDGTAGGFDEFASLIRSGELDRMLLRPRSIPLQVAGFQLTLRRAGRLVQGLLVLSWAMANVKVAWTLPKLALILFSIAGGMCLFYGLLVLQACVSIFTTESLEMMNVLTYGGVETAQYPLSIYRPWFRAFFTFVVPLACVNFLPARTILEKEMAGTFAAWIGWCSPLGGALFLWLNLRLFEWGLARYRSTGS